VRYGSVCSGIEAATAAWHPLGWRPSFFSEIEAFPRAVLAHHYPDVPLHGDFTTIEAGQYDPIDLLVGGTPCQSFSVAGLRGGLDDDRGNLALEYLRLADRLRPRWLVWENVPGVLSSNGGRDFGAILGGMVELGYGVAYRVLDAQFFGLAQRRKRVFVVGYLGDWRRAAAVLFERHILSGNPAPRREAGQGPAGYAEGSFGGFREDYCGGTLKPVGGVLGGGSETFIAHTLKGEGFDASEDGTGRGTPIIPVAYSIMPQHGGKDYKARPVDVAQPVMAGGPVGGNQGGDYIVQPMAFGWQNSASQGDGVSENVTPTLDKSKTPAIAFALRGREGGAMPEVGGDVSNALRTPGGGASVPMVAASAVRRLTPRERERLQGFPDDYTLIPYGAKAKAEFKEELAAYFAQTGQYRREVAPDQFEFDREAFEAAWPRIAADGPRYKALGNSMAVPCMAWIGQRIAMVDAIAAHEATA
jgi:DNA (cytosine-5)-methyltransferase 1